MARRLEAGLPTTHIHICDPPYIRLCLNLTTPHLAALEPTSTSTTPAGMTSLATPATPTRAALAKEEHGEARWSSGRYTLAQAEARRKEAQRPRVRVAEEGARRGVQLGLAELVQVAEELEDVGAASLRQAQRRPVLPQVLPERVPVAPFLRPVPAQRLRPRCRRCPLQRGAVGVRQLAHGSAS